MPKKFISITVPLEGILNNDVSSEEVYENLNVIEKNTERLLNLTNQLLDFRKAETEGFQLYMVEKDVIL